MTCRSTLLWRYLGNLPDETAVAAMHRAGTFRRGELASWLYYGRQLRDTKRVIRDQAAHIRALEDQLLARHQPTLEGG